MDPRIQIEVAVTPGIPAAPRIDSARFLQSSEIRIGTGDTDRHWSPTPSRTLAASKWRCQVKYELISLLNLLGSHTHLQWLGGECAALNFDTS